MLLNFSFPKQRTDRPTGVRSRQSRGGKRLCRNCRWFDRDGDDDKLLIWRLSLRSRPNSFSRLRPKLTPATQQRQRRRHRWRCRCTVAASNQTQIRTEATVQWGRSETERNDSFTCHFGGLARSLCRPLEGSSQSSSGEQHDAARIKLLSPPPLPGSSPLNAGGRGPPAHRRRCSAGRPVQDRGRPSRFATITHADGSRRYQFSCRPAPVVRGEHFSPPAR